MLNDRILPQAIDIERTVLGTILTEKEALLKAVELLRVDTFYHGAHKKIFSKCLELAQEDKPVDIISLNAALSDSNELDIIGGSAYLAELMENITAVNNFEYYCRILLDRWARRDLIVALNTIQKSSYDAETTLAALSDLTASAAHNISENMERAAGDNIDSAEIIDPSSLTERMTRYNEGGIVPKGEETGWRSLDKHYLPAIGTLNIIVGVPAAGKSEFMDALAMNISMNSEWQWLIFSPENYPTEIHIKKLLDKYLNKNIHGCTPEEINTGMQWLSQYFRFIKLSEAAHNFDAMMRLVRGHIKDHKIHGIVIDPWNELDIAPGTEEKETDRIGRQLAILRRFGRRTGCAVFVLVHPAKMLRNRTTGDYDIPTLYDIHGSAHFANKADNGICIHREKDRETGKYLDEIQVHIQKIKFKIHGSQGLVKLFYNKESGRFYEEEEQGWLKD